DGQSSALREACVAMGRGGWACEGARVCPGMALISMHERALSVTALCHERRRFAAMEPLTPPKTHDESMGDLYRPHSASPTSPTAVITDARRAPHQAGSGPRVHHGPAVPLALTIWTRALDGDAGQRAPVSRHRPTIVVPIRMFPGQPPIIIY